MGLITEAVNEELWWCIEKCARINNIDRFHIRNLSKGDAPYFWVGERFRPELEEYIISNVSFSDMIEQINDEIKKKNANAIILGETIYEPGFSDFAIKTKMWFGNINDI